MSTRQSTRTTTKAKTTKPARKTIKTLTNEQIDRAEKIGQFIKAVGSGFLRLSGAPRFWEKNPNQIYNLNYRLTGTLEDIRAVLKEANIPDDAIEESFRTSNITKNNYTTTMKSAFEKEIADAEFAQKRKAAESETPELTLDDLEDILRGTLQITPGAIGLGKTTRRATKTTSPRTSGRGPKSALLERLNSLPQTGFVLDVSSIAPDGTGIKKMKEPTKGGKSKKVGVEGLKIVSNNYRAYNQAIELLGPDYSDYSRDYASRYGTGSEAVLPPRATLSPRTTSPTIKKTAPPGKRTASPTRKRTASPPPPLKQTILPRKTPASPPRKTTAAPITRGPIPAKVSRPLPTRTIPPTTTVQPTQAPAEGGTTPRRVALPAQPSTLGPMTRPIRTGGVGRGGSEGKAKLNSLLKSISPRNQPTN